jgi:class 3 adenylate cyclase/predicted ATPase/predicted RNA-binding Zn-ribbon protein involved in translation (DUF1610 family)
MTDTKTCSSCQSEIPRDSRFCPQCGTAQALGCAACRHVNAAGSRFCSQCGSKLGVAASPIATASPPLAPARSTNLAERRQISVMFCDLVGSTALSTRLDPEDLREVIAAYHKNVTDVVTRFGGYVAKYMGDGVLVYFGYPEARETDAENAVRAALALTDAITERFAEAGQHQVRIGLATGLVVIGELVGAGEAQERNVVGETPNLAARLQAIAVPNTVIIAATTRRLAGEIFEYETIEPLELKGFAEPITAFRVVRERTIAGRFEVLRAATLTPLIGRDEEMELLQRRWQKVKEREGRVVLLCGEPGIGKSRLTTALEESVKHEAHACLRYFCQPHHQGSALQPVLGQLQHAAGFSRDDTVQQKRAKLEKLLVQDGTFDSAVVEPLVELLGLVPSSTATPHDGDPQAERRRILAALIARLDALARCGPVLMLFEDLHWADPTTLELLTQTVELVQRAPILLIMTFRPEFQAPWTGQPHVASLTLNRLSLRDRATLVHHVTGGKTLPPELVEQIAARTDGVPLFVEELTKSVIESGDLQDAGGRYLVDRPAEPLAIPSTLQASLMARVDRLGSAREVLQIGAAIGRDFSYEVLAAAAGLPDAVLQDALIRLVEAELVLIRGTVPDAIYTFRHALIQDAVYSTMLRARRQQLHGAIALVLEKRFPDVVASTPELIAQQFDRAGQSEKAIAYWLRAGDRDLRRFAMKESMAHYANALRLVEAMPETPQRSMLELEVCLGLAMAQQIGLGPTAPEAAATYRRALALSEALPDRGRERFLATWGVWFYNTMAGRPEAFAQAGVLVAIARELDDRDLLLEAYHARGPMLMRTADLPAMTEAAREVIRLYDRERHRDHAYYFGGHDARVCAQSFLAMSLWGRGFTDQARGMAWQAIEDGRALGHAFSHAHGLNIASTTFLLLDDFAACQIVADELYPLAEHNRFSWSLSQARFLRGFLIAQANPADGIEQMLQACAEPSMAVMRPLFLSLIADRQRQAGRLDAALDTLDHATREMNEQQLHFYEAETARLRGQILLEQSADHASEAERLFREAIAVATAQASRSLELRAAISLARLLARGGRQNEAYQLLAPIYTAFTEGFEQADMQAAKTLLAELS